MQNYSFYEQVTASKIMKQKHMNRMKLNQWVDTFLIVFYLLLTFNKINEI